MCRASGLLVSVFLLFNTSPSGFAQQTRSDPSPPSVVQVSLTAPGSLSFHLKATIVDKDDPANPTNVEMFWVSASKWRREIKSQDFSQTLVVNENDVYDDHSDDYVPLAIETLVTAMTDPKPLLATVRPGDTVLTKANGAADESGVLCFGPAQKGSQTQLCTKTAMGLREIVHAPGHPIEFSQYEEFSGKRVARVLVTSPEVGVTFTARITELIRMKHADAKLFEIPHPTPAGQQLRTAAFPEAELRSILPEAHEIIWPQPLDGSTTGHASYYISIDRDGKPRETVVVQSDNERANDSARRQIMKWKFKPPTKDGLPVQAEGILNFPLNTRAWGPPDPLSDTEVRKLASNIVEPNFPSGTAPQGATYTLMIAVDSDGSLIEVIAGGGPPGLSQYALEAIRKWKFSPFMENGEPRPYRGQVDFHVQ
jgi:hypothetical protein